MKNELFSIEIDNRNGCIKSIVNNNDKDNMNWVAKGGDWGRIHKVNWDAAANDYTGAFGELEGKKTEFVSFKEEDNRAVSVYKSDELSVEVTRCFTESGNLVENFRIKNITGTVVCINRDSFGIEIPFNDEYTGADECMIHHCNTHLWCGHNIAWVNALKMGPSEINMGMYLTKGALECYEQFDCVGNSRGKFQVDIESLLLKSGEEYEIEWELFWHKGTDDFYDKISQFDGHIEVRAEHYTLFEGEKLKFDVSAKDDVKVTLLGEYPEEIDGEDGKHFEYEPKGIGELKFKIETGNKSTWLNITVKSEFKTLLEKRVKFIVRNQQCRDKESPLYGAFLVYDNDYDAMYFDYANPDHNACRERMNIPLLLIKYLQKHDDKEVREAVDLFIEFTFREFYEETTGEIFNTIGKDRQQIRLYNAPGVITVFCEMYFLTRDEKYLDHMIKMADHYYSVGGKKCYANGFSVAKVMRAFEMSDNKEYCDKMMKYYHMHVDNMISIGLSYPPHECRYEQTIVTPAVTYIADMGRITDNKEYYLKEVVSHLECLERFSGMQPDCRLNEIAIRYWDDYWFGKARLKGDTLPHHLSVLTARAYLSYADLSKDKRYFKKAEDCIRNCMCLIKDDGRGSAAYVYPYRVNGQRGEIFDPWSNDQDLVLYEAMYFADVAGVFEY